MIAPEFIFLAAALNLIGCVTYSLSIIKGHTKPNRVTWFLWVLIPTVIFLAQISEGVGLPAILTLSGAIGPLIVVITSFIVHKSYWRITRFDAICGILSILALLLWAVTRDGLIAIYLSILADLMAGVPTLVKAYREPQTESATTFGFAVWASVVTLLTIVHWNPATYTFALYAGLFCAVTSILIKFPNFRPTKTPKPS